MKILGVYINKEKPQARVFAKVLLKHLRQKKVSVWLEPDNINKLANTELIIVIGGDGTLLEAFREMGEYEIPFLCVNFGKTGFLSSIEPHEFLDYLPVILANKYVLEEREVMEILINRKNGEVGHYYALNDVVIKSEGLKISNQLLKVDGNLWMEFEGDGIICATSTGSTAYSLSAGGSIIDPQLSAMIITPICSKIASLPPMVLSSDRSVELICNDDCGQKSVVGVDGREIINLSKEDAIIINKALYKAKLIQLKKERYINRLEKRLGINQDHCDV
jgi:NAD+ kinase